MDIIFELDGKSCADIQEAFVWPERPNMNDP